MGASWFARRIYGETGYTLTNVHISPLRSSASGKVQIWVEGSLIKVSKPSVRNGAVTNVKRGKVYGFSRRSRRRLMMKMSMLKRLVLPVFVTLTYPAEFPVNCEQWKLHLDTWAKRLHRRFPRAGFVWRLEPQKRGAPHYHMLIFGVPYNADFQRWVGSSWYQVVGSGDPLHLEYGSHAEPIRSERGVRSYVGKYIGKVQIAVVSDEVDWSQVGRWWGVRYADNLEFSEVMGFDCTRGEAAKLMRFLRRYLQSKGVKVNSQLPGMNVFTANPGKWFDSLDGLLC